MSWIPSFLRTTPAAATSTPTPAPGTTPANGTFVKPGEEQTFCTNYAKQKGMNYASQLSGQMGNLWNTYGSKQQSAAAPLGGKKRKRRTMIGGRFTDNTPISLATNASPYSGQGTMAQPRNWVGGRKRRHSKKNHKRHSKKHHKKHSKKHHKRHTKKHH